MNDEIPQWRRNLARNSVMPMVDLGQKRGIERRRGVVVAAGPSLDLNWQHVAALDAERFFIVAVTTILPAFRQMGIIPDYVICGGEGDASYFLSHLRRTRTQLILSSTAHPASARHHGCPWWYNNRNHRLRERSREAQFPPLWNMDSHAGTMAMHGIKAALLLQQAAPVAVVGLDLEVEDPKRHHAFDVCPIEDFPDVYPDADSGVQIMRNSYAQSLKFVEEWAERNPGLVVNCTRGGAVEGFPRMTLPEFTARYGPVSLQ